MLESIRTGSQEPVIRCETQPLLRIKLHKLKIIVKIVINIQNILLSNYYATFCHYLLLWVELCPSPNSYVGVLTFSTSKCDLIWRWGSLQRETT